MANHRKNKVKDITKDPRYLIFCERYYDNLVRYVLENCRYTPTWQQLEVLEAVQVPGCRVAISSGHGCFVRGHRMRLHNGLELPVEAIKQGDVMRGPDGGPRTVHRLCYGIGKLIAVRFSNGELHIYNDQHNLALQSDKGLHRVPIQDYVHRHDDYKGFCCLKNGSQVSIDSVYPVGDGEYFGFELVEGSDFIDADGYLLENTGKSFLAGWLLDWHLRVFPFSNAMLTATNIDQARSVVWKYIDEAQQDVDRNYPWMSGFFIKQAKSYYAKGYKDSWYVMPKTASKDKPENLAGQHNFNYLVFVDEASGVPDANIGVIKGALTQERNRFVMASQPTRPTGHFAEAMTTLAKGEGLNNEERIYTAITLNTEEAPPPLVTKKFILEKLIEYGGHHSPEYQIKVLGCLPDNLAGYLIPAKWCEDSQHYKISHTEQWGWVLTADVAEGVHRDSSVMTLAKVSGFGPNRKVEVVLCEEFLDLNEKEFAREIRAKFLEYPGLTVAVDADGSGRTVILELEELGTPVERIHWGLLPHASTDQLRYLNQRAYAHLKLREAIFEERFKGPSTKKFVEQASRLPYKLDEKGRYQMMAKEKMRSEGIKSPDISDTCCFFFLVDYIPCIDQGPVADTEESEFLKLAREMMGD